MKAVRRRFFQRKLFRVLVAGIILGASAWTARAWIFEQATTAGIRIAGGKDVSVSVSEVSGNFDKIVLENVAGTFAQQPVSIEKISIERTGAFQPSLGTVTISGVSVPVNVAEKIKEIIAPASDTEIPANDSDFNFPKIPAEKISIDGKIIFQFDKQTDDAGGEKFASEIAVNFDAARENDTGVWRGNARVAGIGIAANAEFSYDAENKKADFRLPAATADLEKLAGIANDFLPADMQCALAGVATISGEGTFSDGKLAAAGNVKLAGGSVACEAKNIFLTGIDADFRFADLPALHSEPGKVTVKKISVAGIDAANAECEIAVAGADKINVTRAALQVFDGHISLEPFSVSPSKKTISVAIKLDGLEAGKILSLAKDIPAAVTGRVDGRVPIRYDENGIMFGTGWLEVRRQTHAEIYFKNLDGLITRSIPPQHPAYEDLQEVERGAKPIEISTLRLDIHKKDDPAGRAAIVRIEGEPAGGKQKVIFDVNVNAPLETLLNLGVKNKMSFETK